jgi:hypothetical protein
MLSAASRLTPAHPARRPAAAPADTLCPSSQPAYTGELPVQLGTKNTLSSFGSSACIAVDPDTTRLVTRDCATADAFMFYNLLGGQYELAPQESSFSVAVSVVSEWPVPQLLEPARSWSRRAALMPCARSCGHRGAAGPGRARRRWARSAQAWVPRPAVRSRSRRAGPCTVQPAGRRKPLTGLLGSDPQATACTWTLRRPPRAATARASSALMTSASPPARSG